MKIQSILLPDIMPTPSIDTMARELETSFIFLNQAFALGNLLSLNIFIGIEMPSEQRFWSTNSIKLQNDFISKKLHFGDQDMWLEPGKMAGEEVITKDMLSVLTTHGSMSPQQKESNSIKMELTMVPHSKHFAVR